MEVKKIILNSLKRDETFNLSFPSRPDRFETWIRKFPHLPPLIINEKNSIIFGIDGYDYLRKKNVTEILVFQDRIPDKDGLFLNFNLKDRFFGCNLYEKLIFFKKIIPLADIKEIRERADLGFPINREILEKLELIIGIEFMDLIISDRINLKAALKICQFKKKDREPLIQLFRQHHFSLSNQFRILDLIQEILFRDKTTVKKAFAKMNLPETALIEKSERNIIDKISYHRYPSYQKAEKKWRNEVKKLKLPADFSLNHAGFFEKKKIQLTISLENFETLKEIIKKLKK